MNFYIFYFTRDDGYVTPSSNEKELIALCGIDCARLRRIRANTFNI